MVKRGRSHPWATLVEFACRAGYAARGAVYASIGVIALLAAFDLKPRSQGAVGALQAWGEWPLGMLLLWFLGLGLYAFAGWRLLQSVFDADRQGTKPMALASRAGQAISGLVYGALGVSVFGLIDTMEDLGEADDREKTSASVEQMLVMPGGEWLVVLVGAFIVACGIGNVVQAIRRDFCEGLTCDDGLSRKLANLGRAGYGARGLVFLTAGSFVMLAGVRARSGEAKGTGAALEWLEALPMGGLLLALTAAGLIAFGLFAFVEARFRRMNVEQVIDE